LLPRTEGGSYNAHYRPHHASEQIDLEESGTLCLAVIAFLLGLC
jgi:hypothetical protein